MALPPPSTPSAPSSSGRRLPRVIGDIAGAGRGPSVVFVGGIHGNEPAGTLAAERVIAELEAYRSVLRGRVVFLAGNRQALGSGLSFVRRDLNRGWSQPNLERLRRLPARALGDEDQEQVELADALREIERAHGGPLVVIDLHTSSAPSPPVVSFGDTLRNRHLAMVLPSTAILGLEEVTDGALVGYCTERGHVGISIESGQHKDPEAVLRQVAAIWLVLVASRCLPAKAVRELAQHRERLARASEGYPRVVEVLHRHEVVPGDGFRMLPGLASFTPVVANQVVAHDARGPVHAPHAALLLMPRYQAQGDDGYFLVREIRPIWLKVSEWLRRAGVPHLVPYLPGVRRDPARPELLVVDPRVARTRVAEVMHLCGFRRRASPDQRYVFSRRGPRR
jgi:hypothetical protein